MAMWGFSDPRMVKFGQFWASPKLVLKWIACFALSSIKLIFHLKDHKNMLEQNSPSENFVIAHTLSLPLFDPFVISATPYQRYPNTPWKYHAQLALFAEILAQYLISPKHSFSSCALPFCSNFFKILTVLSFDVASDPRVAILSALITEKIPLLWNFPQEMAQWASAGATTIQKADIRPKTAYLGQFG